MRHLTGISVAALLLLLLGACQPTPPAARTLTVTGSGEVRAVPDIASLNFSASARNASLDQAEADAERRLTAALDAVRALGIEDKDIRTTDITLHPEYDYRDGQQVFRGYFVNRGITVRVTDLEQLGSIMNAVLRAGINNVSAPQLGFADPREQYRAALQAATDDARANAEVLAAGLSARVGRVLDIRIAGSASPEPMPATRNMMMLAESKDMAMEPGQLDSAAMISVTFELLD